MTALVTGCGQTPDLATARPIAEYHSETGRLTRLSADRNGDGRIDTWAYMDGLLTSRIEIDRDGDGVPDRIEHYEPAPPGAAAPSRISRAEERATPAGPATRREWYRDGRLLNVEEDTDGNGRIDKWEHFVDGSLARLEIDAVGKGYPSRRLIYEPDGRVRVESDPDGDGVFVPMPGER